MKPFGEFEISCSNCGEVDNVKIEWIGNEMYHELIIECLNCKGSESIK